MTSTHLETATRHPVIGRRILALAVLIVTVAAAIATATLTASPETAIPETPSLERLRELASIYDGQQFGWVPSEAADTSTKPLSDAERLRDRAIHYDGMRTDSARPSATAPTPEALQRMADIYEGQFFGPGPLDD